MNRRQWKKEAREWRALALAYRECFREGVKERERLEGQRDEAQEAREEQGSLLTRTLDQLDAYKRNELKQVFGNGK